jgi:hypothetical protein
MLKKQVVSEKSKEWNNHIFNWMTLFTVVHCIVCLVVVVVVPIVVFPALRTCVAIVASATVAQLAAIVPLSVAGLTDIQPVGYE